MIAVLTGRRTVAKAGAAFGYARVIGDHPILATRADTGEVLHVRLRKGSANTARGARRFLDERARFIFDARGSGSSGRSVKRVLRLDIGLWIWLPRQLPVVESSRG